MLRGSSGRHYIGSTTDLERRFEQYVRGQTHSTRRLGDTLELIAKVELKTVAEAQKLERDLKRKKNPRLALFTIEQWTQQFNG